VATIKKQTTKKKHHYVPVSYLKAFCGEDEMLSVYRKDAPTEPIRKRPNDIAFHKYYYAQPLPNGGRDTNRLEDRFAELETKWPPIVDALAVRDIVNDRLEDIFAFVALQRARVPAARDAAEQMLAATVMATARQLKANGKLPPPPKGHESLLDNVAVSIDPHQSIHAIPQIIRAMGLVLHRIGFVVLHNQTDRDFITSDNPVIYFDPAKSNEALRPYGLQPNGNVVLMMPVAPKLMLFGASWDKARFAEHGIEHCAIVDRDKVAAMNEKVVRFSYEAVFAGQEPDKGMMLAHAGCSPVLKSIHLPLASGLGLHFEHVFGERTKLPKWKR
jgi:Protein of unknown function (DUF4238)